MTRLLPLRPMRKIVVRVSRAVCCPSQLSRSPHCDLPSRQIDVAPAPPRTIDAEAGRAASRRAIRFPTISFSVRSRAAPDRGVRGPPRLARTDAIRGCTGRSTQERVGGHGLLYTWQGSDPRLEPILLLAHQDVVPADNARALEPAAVRGDVSKTDFVWGRGAIDDKGSLVAICEAVEHLLGEGYTPKRTVLLAFGHDEEVGGAARRRRDREAARVARRARAARARRGLRRRARPAARLRSAGGADGNLGEGIGDARSRRAREGGHSSTPPRQSASGILARAIERLEANPLPGGVVGVTRSFFEYLAPELPL